MMTMMMMMMMMEVITLVRQTVCRDPQLTSITEHSDSFFPLEQS